MNNDDSQTVNQHIFGPLAEHVSDRTEPVSRILRKIPFVFLMMMSSGLLAQTFTANLECNDAVPGDTICVDWVANEDIELIGAGLTFTFDPSVLSFEELIPILPNPATVFTFLPGPSDLRVLWLPPDLSTTVIPAGSTIWQICFEVIGIPGDSTTVDLSPGASNELIDTIGLPVDFEMVTTCNFTTLSPNEVGARLSACGPATLGGDGSFTITGYGGTPPYTYSWDNGSGVSGTSTLNAEGDSETQTVPFGNYDITIEDGTSTSTYTIEVPLDQYIVNATVSNELSCYNTEDARITVESTGDSPFVIWENTDNPIFSGSEFFGGSSATINSLGPGNYEITISDATGCAFNMDLLVDAREFNFDVTYDSVTCLGTADGQANITISGGLPNVFGEYPFVDWQGSLFPWLENDPLQLALLEGDTEYELTVSDTRSLGTCDTTFRFTVPVSTATGLFAAVDIDPPSCGNEPGLVTLTPTQPGPFTYFWLDTNGVQLEQNTVGSWSAPPGDYRVAFEETAGVCRSDTIDFTIQDAPNALVIDTIYSTLSGCPPFIVGGTATVEASGGTPGYTFEWTNAGGANAGNTPTISDLPPGSYSVTVTDNSGCTTESSVVVAQARRPQIDSIFPVNLPCTNTPTASVTFAFTAGDAPLDQINWLPSGIESDTLEGLTPGDTISLFIADSFFCFDTENTFVVPGGSDLLIDSFRVEPPACGGDANGRLSVFIAGGIPPLSYMWSNGDTTQVISGLTAGTYSVTVTSNDTCGTVIDTVELPDGPLYGYSIVSIDSATCATGRNDGAVEIAGTGGNPSQEYTFAWGTGQRDTGFQSFVLDQPPGWVTVSISQDPNCFFTDSILIPSPDPVAVDTLQLDNSTCFSTDDGIISVLATGGNGNYSYAWDILPAGPIQTGLAPGRYRLVVTDLEGCTYQDSFDIAEPDTLVLQVDSSSITTVNCNNPFSGAFALQTSGGNGSYVYSWSPDAASDSVGMNLGIGNYSVTVTDARGCQDSTSFFLAGDEPVTGYVAPVARPRCIGETTTIRIDSVTGGSGGYTWTLNGGQQFPVDTSIQVPVGVYTVVVRDSANCRDTTSGIIVTSPPPIELSVIPPEPVVDLGDSLQLLIIADSTQGPVDSITWSPNGPLSCYDCIDPSTYNVRPVIYEVQLWDSAGCDAAIDVFVDVNTRRKVFVPNIFSPNRDGRNDEFIIFTGQGVTAIPVARVFDRWGQLVAEQVELAPNADGVFLWDGTRNGEEMPPGVYVYVMEVIFADRPEQPLVYRGDVTLVR